MHELALASAGVIVFMLTTWASLAFGYQVFQDMFETDQADGEASPLLTTDDRAIPVLTVVASNDEVARSSELLKPTAPAA